MLLNMLLLYIYVHTHDVLDSSIALGENSERKQEGMSCIMCPLMVGNADTFCSRLCPQRASQEAIICLTKWEASNLRRSVLIATGARSGSRASLRGGRKEASRLVTTHDPRVDVAESGTLRRVVVVVFGDGEMMR